jgi:ATP-dependent helicase HrpB
MILPIDPFLPRVVEQLRTRSNLVLCAEPGAGKTTRVPPALLNAGIALRGQIIVLEPRRMAARLAARFVASELGEPVGQRVGYQVRFEDKSSLETRIRFVTEGILTRKLVGDPALADVDVVVFDEFHERHLHGDIDLSWLRRLQRTSRPELKLVAMSATLDAKSLCQFLDAPLLEVPGRRYEVSIEHDESGADKPIEQRVLRAVKELLRDGLTGSVLVFLPGAVEIRRTRDVLDEVWGGKSSHEVVVLHGDLTGEEQDRAVTPGPRPKIILSTNVAESSVTIDGVVAVIDSGLVRIAKHSPWSGLPTLTLGPASRASAAQRAGRAGRQSPGRCIRLYSKRDLEGRPEHEAPEIARVDLSEMVLSVSAIAGDFKREDFFETPPVAAYDAAVRLLYELGARDRTGALTPLGARLLRLPVHPRLGRLMLEAVQRGAPRQGCLAAALLSERDIWLGARRPFGERNRDVEAGPSDLQHRMDLFEAAEDAQMNAARLRQLALDPGAVRSVQLLRGRLWQSLGAAERDGRGDQEPGYTIQIAALAGFFDRVASRRPDRPEELVFARGGSCVLGHTSAVRTGPLCVVIDAAQELFGMHHRVVARLVSAIESDFLLELFADRIVDEARVVFEPSRQRVERVRQLRYEGIVLEERRDTEVADPEAARVLADAAIAAGLAALWDIDALTRLAERLRYAAKGAPDLRAYAENPAHTALVAACDGLRSFAELRQISPEAVILARLSPAQRDALNRGAPEHIQLPGGRRLAVQYRPGKPPWVQSRLQDFFGMGEGPRVGGEPLVIHLLAPSGRPVQVTTDLLGFWRRHYPELRHQLMRRYPKHAWPQDPLRATPPKPKPRQGERAT